MLCLVEAWIFIEMQCINTNPWLKYNGFTWLFYQEIREVAPCSHFYLQLTEQYNPCRIIYFDEFPRTPNSRKVGKVLWPSSVVFTAWSLFTVVISSHAVAIGYSYILTTDLLLLVTFTDALKWCVYNYFQVSKKRLREEVAEMVRKDPLLGVTKVFMARAEKMGAKIDESAPQNGLN